MDTLSKIVIAVFVLFIISFIGLFGIVYLYQTKIDRTEIIDIPLNTDYLEFKCPDGQTYAIPRPDNVKSAKELEYYIKGYCASIAR